MRIGKSLVALVIIAVAFDRSSGMAHQAPSSSVEREKIIIDTDIGDDIDDAFAVALALRSPELEILGITTDFGDTAGRAKILDRMLGEVGRADIPVAVGNPTKIDATFGDNLSQRRYGEMGHFSRASYPKATDFILKQIERYPNQITLVTIGPLPNIGELVRNSPGEFKKLKRVVMMGGSIGPLRPDYGRAPAIGPLAEWNIKGDVSAAQGLFSSGVPIYMMPLDSTAHLQLDEVNRNILFSEGVPLTDALALLYHQWSERGAVTPTLFDPMTIAYLLKPEICPVEPMHIRVDDMGFTRTEAGPANAQVCMHSEAAAFFDFYMKRVLSR